MPLSPLSPPGNFDLSQLANLFRGQQQEPQAVPMGIPTPTPRPDSPFESGIKNTDWYNSFQKRYGETPNLNDPVYNYRRAWELGVRPQPDSWDQNFPHWPDRAPNGEMLKSPDHPTVWMEYFMNATGGKNPEALGLKDYGAAKQFLGHDFVPQDVLSAIQKREK